MMKLAPYPGYKESASPAAPKIPDQWTVHRCRYLFREVDERSKDGHETHLSMSQKHGLIDSSKIDKWRLQSESYAGGKLCKDGDLVLNRLKAHLGVFAHAKQSGVVSPDYTVLRPITDDSPRFFELLFKSPTFITEFTKSTKGIVKGFWRLYTDDFYSIRAVVPPPEEQKQILGFIDSLTARANKFIRNKRRLIELLKEQKQNVINQAVTRGLDPKVQFKPSGVEWIGDIPEHWEVRRLKFLARIRNGQDYKEVEAESGYPVMGSGGQFAYSSAFMYEGESVLFGRKGTIDKPLYINGRFWTVDTMFYTEVSKLVSAKFLYFSALSFPFDYYSTKTALPSMTQQDLGNHPVALPPRDEQELIIQYIEEESQLIDQAITRAQREIELMREYRTRLISDVVTGQVDVRGIEVPDVAEDELLAMEEDTADADDVIDDEGEMDETD
jgi:type I restriction enzyme S subunit